MLEGNTVILDLDEYDKLREIEKTLAGNGVIMYESYGKHISHTWEVFSKEEAITKLLLVNGQLKDSNELLRNVLRNERKKNVFQRIFKRAQLNN